MESMQAFYDSLFQKEVPTNPYRDLLVRLTTLSIHEIESLKSVITWAYWNAEES
jgi:hypothetical protein